MIAPPLLSLIVLLAPPQAAGEESAQAESAPVWSPRERSAIELLRSLRNKQRPPDDELARTLAENGEALLPLLFQVVQAREVPGPDGEKPQVLSEIQENVILLAVGLMDRNAVLAEVGARTALEQGIPTRLAALSLTGAVGRGNDFPALFSLALQPGEREPDRRLEKALARAVTSILVRDGKAFEQLVFLRRIVPPELLSTVVQAVGDTHDSAGLAFLSEVAYWNKDLIQDVMSQVRLVGLSDVASVNEAMRVRLRPYLDETQPGNCRAAILALTALEDIDSIAPLITLLGCEDTGLRETAHWALRTLTGMTLAQSQEHWARWHQAELAWLVREKPREFQRLRSNDAGVVAASLRTILAHRLALEELRQALPELLRHRVSTVRMLACQTLAELNQAESISNLVWTLEDEDPNVARAAWQALKRITGLDLENDPAAWQAATDTEPADARP